MGTAVDESIARIRIASTSSERLCALLEAADRHRLIEVDPLHLHATAEVAGWILDELIERHPDGYRAWEVVGTRADQLPEFFRDAIRAGSGG